MFHGNKMILRIHSSTMFMIIIILSFLPFFTDAENEFIARKGSYSFPFLSKKLSKFSMKPFSSVSKESESDCSQLIAAQYDRYQEEFATDSKQHVEDPFFQFQMRFRKALPLLRQTGPIVIAVIFAILSFRNLGIANLMKDVNSQLIVSTSITRFITNFTSITLFLCNIIGLIGNIIIPSKFKNYSKLLFVGNLFREIVGLILNMIIIGWITFILNTTTTMVDSYTREVHIGMFVGNLFWSMMLYSLLRTRWITEVTPAFNPNSPVFQPPHQQKQQQNQPRISLSSSSSPSSRSRKSKKKN
jgi:hypothetical protein